MEFKIDRDVFLKSLSHVQGVVEKKNTLPILGNVMFEANENFLKITAKIATGVIVSKLSPFFRNEANAATGRLLLVWSVTLC